LTTPIPLPANLLVFIAFRAYVQKTIVSRRPAFGAVRVK
jgi:hypothetical protein